MGAPGVTALPAESSRKTRLSMMGERHVLLQIDGVAQHDDVHAPASATAATVGVHVPGPSKTRPTARGVPAEPTSASVNW